MMARERLFVNGFRSQCVVALAETLSLVPGVAHIYWLRDALGAKDLPKQKNITVLDSVAALHVRQGSKNKSININSLSPILRECFFAIQPAAINMMNRLERYGPAVPLKKRGEIFLHNFFFSLELIEQEKITGFISSGVPHEITDFIFSEICRVKNIKALIFFQVQTDLITTVSHYTCLGTDAMSIHGHLSEVERKQRSMVGAKMNQQYRPAGGGGPVTHFYMKEESRKKVAAQQEQGRRERMRGKLGAAFTKLFSKNSWRYAYYLLYEKRVIEKRRTEQLWETYRQKSICPEVLDEPFVLLFLHYQPEMTTSPLAEEFVEQFLVADLLMQALPEGCKLYVKEHPAQTIVGRTPNYYGQFPKDDRLVFVDANYSSAKLQKNALAIATCTGTAGFEAIWKGMPVLVFGNAYYQGGPNVFRVRNAEDAMRALTNISERKSVSPEGAVNAFIEDLISRCRPGNLSDPYFWNSQLAYTEPDNTNVLLREIQAWLDQPTTIRRESLQNN